MASDKQKRKANSIDRRGQLGGMPPKVKDGDRRRRTPTDLVRDAIARKRMVQDWNIDVGPSPETGGSDDDS
jgi:hypothetical protein